MEPVFLSDKSKIRVVACFLIFMTLPLGFSAWGFLSDNSETRPWVFGLAALNMLPLFVYGKKVLAPLRNQPLFRYGDEGIELQTGFVLNWSLIKEAVVFYSIFDGSVFDERLIGFKINEEMLSENSALYLSQVKDWVNYKMGLVVPYEGMTVESESFLSMLNIKFGLKVRVDNGVRQYKDFIEGAM